MRRRVYIAATASALVAPLTAGCSRDDGGDDGGGPYGMAATGPTDAASGSSGVTDPEADTPGEE